MKFDTDMNYELEGYTPRSAAYFIGERTYYAYMDHVTEVQVGAYYTKYSFNADCTHI